MATCGEFIDKVSKTESYDAQDFVNEWKNLVTEEKWAQYRSMNLTPELVYAFATDMSAYFADRLHGICTNELYKVTAEDGHLFLRDVHRYAVELGVGVDLARVDLPLTISEAMLRSRHAKVI